MLQWHTADSRQSVCMCVCVCVCVCACTEEETEDAVLDSFPWCVYKKILEQKIWTKWLLICRSLRARLPRCYLLLFNNAQTHCRAEIRCFCRFLDCLQPWLQGETAKCHLTCLHNSFCSPCKVRCIMHEGRLFSKVLSMQHLGLALAPSLFLGLFLYVNHFLMHILAAIWEKQFLLPRAVNEAAGRG